jgi:hypothetical protein
MPRQRRAERVDWLQAIEGLVVGALVVVLIAAVIGWDRVAGVLARVDPVVYSFAFLAVGGWLVAWSETLGRLLDPYDVGLDRSRLRIVFVAAMGLRGFVPGGSITGPAVTAYVIKTYSDADLETSLASTTLAEFAFWLGSAIVGAVGFAGILIGQAPAGYATSVAVSMGTLALLVVGFVLLGVWKPAIVENPLLAVAAVGYATLGRVSDRAREALDPTTVERRIERFFGALRQLAQHPRRMAIALGYSVLGWLCFVSPLWLSLAALGEPVSPAVVMFVVPIGGITHSLSILPGGIGAVEGSMAGLLSILTPLSLGMVGTGVLLARLVTYWFRLLLGGGALLYLAVTERSPTGAFDAEGRA